MPAVSVVPAPAADHLAVFTAVLPAVRAPARATFRSLRSAHDRENAEAEVVARMWERFAAVPPPPAATAERLAAPAVASSGRSWPARTDDRSPSPATRSTPHPHGGRR